MTDVHLVWFTIPEECLPAVPYLETVALAQPLGFAMPAPRDSKVSAFIKACATTTTYTDEGQEQVLRAVQSRRTPEFITFQVLNEADLAVAEYKFFQSRRGPDGRMIPQSHSIRSVVRRQLTDEQRAGANAWLQVANARFQELAYATPMTVIRRIARESMLAEAVPLTRFMKSMYFVYDDQIEWLDKLSAFLAATLTHPPTIWRVAVEDLSDYSVFITCADEYLAWQVQEVCAKIDWYLGGQGQSAKAVWLQALVDLRAQAVRHRRRLRCDLVLTDQALLLADQRVSQLTVRPACPP